METVSEGEKKKTYLLFSINTGKECCPLSLEFDIFANKI